MAVFDLTRETLTACGSDSEGFQERFDEQEQYVKDIKEARKNLGLDPDKAPLSFEEYERKLGSLALPNQSE